MRGGSRLRLWMSIATAVAALLGVVRPATAVDMNAVWPELGLPGFKITPFITQRVDYQANVLLQPRNELDDLISRTIPGVTVELPFGRNRLDLSVRAEILRYLERSQFDAEHVFGQAGVTMVFGGNVRARLRAELARTSDPPGTELTGRIKSTTYNVAPDIEYALAGRFAVGANYAYTRVSFDDTATQINRDEHTVGASVFYKIFPKSDLYANVAYGTKRFEEDATRDADRYIGSVGVRGELTAKLSSTFRIGYEYREGRAGDTTTSLVTSGDWTFAATERTRFSLLTQRSIEESTFASNATFIATVATLTAEHRFGPKLRASARVFGGLNEYPNKDLDVDRFHRRVDWLLGAGLGVDYQIQRWLGVGADYSFSNRTSNFQNLDYTDHVLGLKITLSL